MKIDQARKALAAKGFQIIEHPYATMMHSRHGKVIAQRMVPPNTTGRLGSASRLLNGSGIGAGRTIELWYYDLNTHNRPRLPGAGNANSGNPAQADEGIMVPFVIGLTSEQASLLLQKAGLVMRVTGKQETFLESFHDTVANQNPMAGTRVEPNSAVGVSLYVFEDSRGRQPFDPGPRVTINPGPSFNSKPPLNK